MPRYLIHTCLDRDWYVQDYLIPSMMDQRINRVDISVYVDTNGDGCLQSFINSVDGLKDAGDTWHLQDDVLICRNFKERTEQHYDVDLVCGFASKYDKIVRPGKAKGINNIWYSFPCIRIPNRILKHFAIWFNSYIQHDNRYVGWIESKKNDDLLFRYFLKSYYKEIEAINLAPNLVEHVDWLIGGSLVNQQRDEIVRSLYWEDEELVENLENILKSS